MVELRRTVRFAINPEGGSAPVDPANDVNGFAGIPAMRGLGRHYELDLTCRGEPDPATGYLINIKDLDSAVRERVVPLIERACGQTPWVEPAGLLPGLVAAVAEHLAGSRAQLQSIRWRLSPTYNLEMGAQSTDMAVIRQRFDFAAAHRLHVPTLSDEENRSIFGKCNNPAGHGHNYRIEPAVGVGLSGERPFSLIDLERVTDRVLIQRFDHKHLNEDTGDFGPGSGVNPSVENMARVFFELLAPAIDRESRGTASLRSITVWETEKTSATFPA